MTAPDPARERIARAAQRCAALFAYIAEEPESFWAEKFERILLSELLPPSPESGEGGEELTEIVRRIQDNGCCRAEGIELLRAFLASRDRETVERCAKAGREACESRAHSLFHDSKQITASGEASKCAMAVESAIRDLRSGRAPGKE